MVRPRTRPRPPSAPTRPAVGALVVAAVSALLTVGAACTTPATDPASVGASDAGPEPGTRAGAPAGRRPIVPAAGQVDSGLRPPRTGAALCAAWGRHRIATVLGLPVRDVEVEVARGVTSCWWRARDAPPVPSWRNGDPVLAYDDGVVAIHRGRATTRPRLERWLLATARTRKADAREDLLDIGLDSFAVGGSVSGVPVWQGLAVHDEVVTAVEVSGAGTRSSVRTLKSFLAEVVAGP